MATARSAAEVQAHLASQYEVQPPPPTVGPAPPSAYATIAEEGLGAAEREILYAVRAALDRYEPIRASGSRLELRLRDGAVVVSGRVRSLPLKVMTERLAGAAARGRRLVSELIADPDLVTAVATALALDPRTNLCPVFVEASLGIVRLSGPVPTAAMAAAAEEIARGVPGVAEVRNELVPAEA